MMQNNEELAPPPGIWRTIAAGFDLTTKHLWLLILPILVDAFLWLGPRLSSRPIIEQMVGLLPQDAALQDISEQMLALAPRTNLFTSLSVPFIGIPVLMVGATPENTPLPVEITELANPLAWLGLFLLFLILGVLITAVYYNLIAQVIRLQEESALLSPLKLLGRMGKTWLQLLGLGIIIAIVSIIIYIPLLPITFVVALFSQTLATLVLLIGPVLILWLLIFTYFVPHSLSLFAQPLHLAMLTSVQLVRFYFTPMLMLLVTILIIRNVLGSLLILADDGSWLTGIGILGHAFVMTSLITATFIFFRDRYVVLEEKLRMVSQLKGSPRL
ncbi:MAG: hypothetical protein GWP17_02585 [Aquificales bacterium]|nr:hypothetical protein [Aquificales bacterium]